MTISITTLLISLSLCGLLVFLLTLLLVKKTSAKQDILADRLRREFHELREEIARTQTHSQQNTVQSIEVIGKTQHTQLQNVEQRLQHWSTANETQLHKLRQTLDGRLQDLQASNEKKLEQMRHTVDEKLQSTLEKRLSESFAAVSQRLEAVHQGLGEMKELATGVGDLKRVLSNVKVRGTWGEVQLGALLEQILTADQYADNVQLSATAKERVEYAIRLPGQDNPVWLPIDAKFPMAAYQRLVDSSENTDPEAIKKDVRALLSTIEKSAQDIANKYIDPPHTTDFAIMFLPTEGLYAEVLRTAGLVERLQQKYRVVIAGPTTLSAILNSLQMGFRTLAIEQRSSEVWQILATVKQEFAKFSTVLDKVKKQLATAANTIDQTSTRTKVMQTKLRNIETLPVADNESSQLPDEGIVEDTLID